MEPTLLKRITPSVLALLLIGVLSSEAQDWIPLDARSQGMGNAGVALAEGVGGLYWNPALAASGAEKIFDFSTGSGFAIHGLGNASLEGGLISDVMRVIDQYSYSEFSELQEEINLGFHDADTFQEVLHIFSLMLEADRPEKGVLTRPAGGIELRFGPLAVFARILGRGAGDPVVDLSPGSSLAFTSGDLAVFFSGLGVPGALSPAGSALSAALVGTDARLGLDSDGDGASDADELAYQAQAALGDARISDPAFIRAYCQAAAATLANAGTGNTSATLYYNNSGVEVRTLIQFETGLTLGVPLFPTLLEAGLSFKEIITESFSRRLTYWEIDENEDLWKRIKEEYREQRKRSNDFNLDLGLLFRPASWMRVGIAARNLIPMKVEVAGWGEDLSLRPQIRAGMSIRLLDLINVGADLDLTENREGLLPGLVQRHFGGGIEFDLPVLKLRGGYTDNLASSTGRGTLTAGLGIRIGGFALDLSAQAGLQERIVRPLAPADDGDKWSFLRRALPERALVGISLGFDSGF